MDPRAVLSVPDSSSMRRTIELLLDGGSQEGVVPGFTSFPMRSFKTLAPGNWLNDDVLNEYFTFLNSLPNSTDGSGSNIKRKCYVWNTFFFAKLTSGQPEKSGVLPYNYRGVSTWAPKRNIDLLSYRYILVPVHASGGTHWCLAVIDNERRTVSFVDSLEVSTNAHANYGSQVVMALCRFMEDYCKDRSKAAHTDSVYSVEGDYGPEFEKVFDIPTQTNLDDCGVFVCLSCLALIFGWSLSVLVDQKLNIRENSVRNRYAIAKHLLTKKLL